MTVIDPKPQIRVMPTLARMTIVLLVAYTVLSMAMQAAFESTFQLSVGPVSIYVFDLILAAALVLLYRELLRDARPIAPSNRTVVFLVLGYCAYQIAVILPVSVIFFDLEPIAVMRQLTVRFGLVLIPFVYLAALRYVSPMRVILLVNAAAMGLALYALYRYATVGPTFDSGTRLRELWGGATLLFGFSVLSSLFLMRRSAAVYAVAAAGMIGITLTNHRSGYLALLVVTIPLFLHLRRTSARAIVVVLVVLATIGVMLVASPTVRESTFYSVGTMLNPNADANARDRVDRSRMGWDYFAANPLGDYTWSQRFYLVDLGPEPFEPHNFVVQILGQQGIVGFAFIAAILAATVRIAWRHRGRDRMSAVMLACLSFYLVFNLFNTTITNPWNIMLLAVPVGIILNRNDALTLAKPRTVATDCIPPEAAK